MTRESLAAKNFSARLVTQPSRKALLSDPQIGILLTVLYSDLFDYPLRIDELHEYLCTPLSREELDTWSHEFLTREGDLICWQKREEIFELRSERQVRAESRQAAARIYGQWVQSIPFVRLAGISGSQAAGNARQDSDLDFFLITAPRRLWTVQFFASLLRHIGRIKLGLPICPNFVLASDSLDLAERNLYGAREIAQLQPLWGLSSYRAFLSANDWMKGYLPNWSSRKREKELSDSQQPRWVKTMERLLQGLFGDALEASLYTGMLLYYRFRLAGRGWRMADLKTWYSRNQQKVIRGGYAPVVMARFREQVQQRLGNRLPPIWLEQLAGEGDEQDPDQIYEELMAESYRGTT